VRNDCIDGSGGGAAAAAVVVSGVTPVPVMGVLDTGEEATLQLGSCCVAVGRTAPKLRKPDGDDVAATAKLPCGERCCDSGRRSPTADSASCDVLVDAVAAASPLLRVAAGDGCGDAAGWGRSVWFGAEGSAGCIVRNTSGDPSDVVAVTGVAEMKAGGAFLQPQSLTLPTRVLDAGVVTNAGVKEAAAAPPLRSRGWPALVDDLSDEWTALRGFTLRCELAIVNAKRIKPPRVVAATERSCGGGGGVRRCSGCASSFVDVCQDTSLGCGVEGVKRS
jgi:hypothetical protein